MNSKDQLETPNFTRTINTINQHYFPKSFPTHWHPYVEMLAVPKGANNEQPVIVHVGTTTYELTPNSVLFIWPGELHSTEKNSNEQIIAIQFPPRLLQQLPEFAEIISSLQKFELLTAEEYPELTENLIACMIHMIELHDTSAEFYQSSTLITFYEMFVSFAKYLTSQGLLEYGENQNPTSIKITEACDYISDHCADSLTLESVAEQIGFSPYYFSRTFKKHMGMGFVEYLTLQRINKAQTLLSDGSLSVTEISYQSGFHSISTFNRTFLKCKGCSPSAYRKMNVKTPT